MYINDLKFAGRKVLQNSQKNDYSPKKRWDQGSFGIQRALLFNHVENMLREHQNDGDILDKFRKQAEQLKMKKRKQKFPHLYPSQIIQQNRSFTPKIKSQSSYFPDRYIPEEKIEVPPQIRTIQSQRAQLPPQIVYKIDPIPNYMNQLESQLQYEKIIAKKDLQLYKRQAKIKKQRNKIQKLYKELRTKEKQEQLERYLKYKDGINRVNRALSDIKMQLSERKPKLIQRKKTQQQNNQANHRFTQYRNQNKSEVFLKNNQDKLPIMSRVSSRNENIYQTISSNSSEKNPEIIYSPKGKKNKSSVFQNVNLFNPVVKLSQIDGHLQELTNYNKKLEYFHSINHQKLRRIQK